MILIDFLLWLAAAAIYPMSYYAYHADAMIIDRALLQNVLIGLVTTAAAFFILEFVLQKLMVPYFFPRGGLPTIPGTLRIRIRTRLAALIMACNLIPFLALMAIARGSYRTDLSP